MHFNYTKIWVCTLLITLSLSLASYSQQPSFSHQPGFYSSGFDLTISCPVDFPTPWVTFDGSFPGPDNPESEPANGAISIQDRTGDPNVFSVIPLNNGDDNIPDWLPPVGNVDKATVVGAVCVDAANELTEMKFQTFFVGLDDYASHDLAIISIISPPDSLFGEERGIMVPGVNYQEGSGTSGNYFQRGLEWERLVHIEFFEPGGELGFGHYAGARIHGNFSRSYPMKSIRLYSRSDYGTSRFEYPIFEDQPVQRYNRFILRNSGQDFESLMLRDAVSQQFFRSLDVETQDYRPAVKFLNGEFWGIFNIREFFNRHYFDRVHGIDRDKLDYLVFEFNSSPSVNDGDRDFYNEMLDFAVENDLSDADAFNEISTMLDTDDFIDQLVINIYSSNNDWPASNQRIYRKRTDFTPGAGTKDGRFRWLINDLDRSFGLFNPASHNNLQRMFTDSWYNVLFQVLLENDEFKDSFINRHADFMHSYLKPEHAHQIIDAAAERIEAMIPLHVERWQYPTSVSSWEGRVNSFRNWISNRPEIMQQQIIDQFDLAGTAGFTLDISETNAGIIRLNSIKVSPETDGIGENSYPFDATYFAGIPVRLEAIPNAGYRFDGWEGLDADGPVAFADPAGLDNVTAVFAFEPFEGDEMNPVAWDLSQGNYEFNFWDQLEPAGTFPTSMIFQQSDLTDPRLEDEMTSPYDVPEDEYHEDDQESIGFPYNLTRRTRINGLGDRGISFINTGRGRDLGAAVLALDTRDVDQVYVSFRAGTEDPNSRIYGLRLQYRVGTQNSFEDVIHNGVPVEYIRNENAGHSTIFRNIPLPADAVGLPYVQIRWKYHHIEENSGPRAELSLGDVVVSEEIFVSIGDDAGSEVPMALNLHQNYPNPFNPVTQIRYDLPEATDVTLEVFNAIGQRVAVLVNGHQNAGNHITSFDASTLSSGVYLYRITAGNMVQTRKMMLVK